MNHPLTNEVNLSSQEQGVLEIIDLAGRLIELPSFWFAPTGALIGALAGALTSSF
ncbi:MAG: hypothetical protein OXF46_11510 [Rhodobacteraceae bacterium]|nr:hypothetical protein [Paracoccaceae bacterium]